MSQTRTTTHFDNQVPSQRKKLASFVLENCEEVKSLVAQAAGRLRELTGGDESFSAYVTGGGVRTDLEVRALFEHLQDAGSANGSRVAYALEPPPEETQAASRQAVRLAPEVVRHRRGVCLDLVLLLAGLLRQAGIFPLIAVTNAHVVLGYWRHEEPAKRFWAAAARLGRPPAPRPPVLDGDRLRRLYRRGLIGLVDATAIARTADGEAPAFAAVASQTVRRNLKGIRYAVDLYAARQLAGIGPISIDAAQPEQPAVYPQSGEHARHGATFGRRPAWTALVGDYLNTYRRFGGYLLLVGGEGEGKSAFISDRVRSAGAVIHFIRHDEPGWADPMAMLESLRWQLWERHGVDGSAATLAGLARATQAPARDRAAAMWRAAAEVLSNQLKHLSEIFEVTGESETLYIDGLDEAFGPLGLHRGIPGLPGLLPSRMPPRICAVLTSRPGEHLGWLQDPGLCTQHRLEDTREENIAEAVDYILELGAHIDPPITDSFAQAFARHAQGNFYIVSRKLAEIAIEPKAERDPSLIPATVQALHRETLGLLFKRARRRWPRSAERRVRTALGWQVVAARRLSPTELEAFGASEETETILDWASGYFAPRAAHRQPTLPYEFNHGSASDFIATEIRHAERMAVGAALARACLRWKVLGGSARQYALRHLVEHAVGAGLVKQAAGVLLDYEYLCAALGLPEVQAVPQSRATAALTPFELRAQFATVEGKLDNTHWARRALSVAGCALDLSAHVLAQQPCELPSQLLGRLPSGESTVIDRLRGACKSEHRWLWLHPISSTLTAPGGAMLRTLEGHTEEVSRAALWGEHRVVSASTDGTLRAWDLNTGACLHSLEGHIDRVTHFALWGGHGAVSASRDKTLRVWDLEMGACLRTLYGHTGSVNHVALWGEGRAVSASSDGTLRLWDLETGACLRTMQGHRGSVNHVALWGKGRAVSASWDKTLRVWDLETGACLRTLEGHTWPVAHVTRWGEARALSASWDGTLRAWDLETGACLRKLEGHTNWVMHVALWCGDRAVSASKDKTLRVWDLETGACLRTLEGHEGWVTHVSVSAESRAVSASSDGTLGIWDLETGACLRKLEGHTDWVMHVALWCGVRAVSASKDKTLRVWGLETVAGQRALHAHTDAVSHVALWGKGSAVSASWDKSLRVWDLETGGCLRTLEGHAGAVHHVAVWGEHRAVSASRDETLRVWDLETGACLRTLRGHCRFGFTHVALCGARVVAASRENALWAWDPGPGERPCLLYGHSGQVSHLELLNEGRAVSASQDKTLRVWDLVTGACQHTLRGHWSGVNHVVLWGQGHAISASSDKTLRVWDLDTGACLRMLEGHKSSVTDVALWGAGRAVSTSWDNTLRVWDLASALTVVDPLVLSGS